VLVHELVHVDDAWDEVGVCGVEHEHAHEHAADVVRVDAAVAADDVAAAAVADVADVPFHCTLKDGSSHTWACSFEHEHGHGHEVDTRNTSEQRERDGDGIDAAVTPVMAMEVAEDADGEAGAVGMDACMHNGFGAMPLLHLVPSFGCLMCLWRLWFMFYGCFLLFLR